MPSWEDRATASGNMGKSVKFGSVVFELCEQTDRRTNSSQYFAPLPGGGGQEPSGDGSLTGRAVCWTDLGGGESDVARASWPRARSTGRQSSTPARPPWPPTSAAVPERAAPAADRSPTIRTPPSWSPHPLGQAAATVHRRRPSRR